MQPHLALHLPSRDRVFRPVRTTALRAHTCTYTRTYQRKCVTCMRLKHAHANVLPCMRLQHAHATVWECNRHHCSTGSVIIKNVVAHIMFPPSSLPPPRGLYPSLHLSFPPLSLCMHVCKYAQDWFTLDSLCAQDWFAFDSTGRLQILFRGA